MNIPFLNKKKKKNKIVAQFINEFGKIEHVDIDPEDEKVIYDGGTYTTDKKARLLDIDNRPTFIYIKGKPTPLIFNFGDIVTDSKTLKGGKVDDTIGDIKIDARPLKAVLRAKLFGDLLSGDTPKPWDIIMDVLAIVNIILTALVLLQVTGVFAAVITNG